MSRSVVGGVVLALVLLAGCSRGDGGRSDARDEFVAQLVSGGLDAEQAECIAEAFFEPRSNDELNEFFEREELTDDERAELASITRDCVEQLPASPPPSDTTPSE